jgi:hypothetical protein
MKAKSLWRCTDTALNAGQKAFNVKGDQMETTNAPTGIHIHQAKQHSQHSEQSRTSVQDAANAPKT